MVEVKYVGNEPTKALSTDAAYDLRSAELSIISPGETQLVRTGTQVAIPEGAVGMVCSRSGLANKYGLFVLNAPGIIDPGYIGDVGVILHNIGKEDVFINEGDRIAQLLILPTESTKFVRSHTLEKTERGEGGFGHTGVA